MPHDRLVNQHQPGLALYPRNLSYDLLPLIGPSGWSLLRALHDHADEQALTYRGTRPIAPSSEELQALAGVGEASLLVIKELLHVCGCLSWEEIRGKQEPRPGRQLKQLPTRSLVYYLHPLTGLTVTLQLVQRVLHYLQRSERAQAYLKANGLFRPQPAFLPTSVWPTLLPYVIEQPAWEELFQQIHGPTKHLHYRTAVTSWLRSAAQIVATLEWEQQRPGGYGRGCVEDHAITVMARWQSWGGVPSSGQHGPLEQNHGEIAFVPRTPLNELTNQPTNEQMPSAQQLGTRTKRKGQDRAGVESEQRDPKQITRAAVRPERRADAGMPVDPQVETVDQPNRVPFHRPTADSFDSQKEQDHLLVNVSTQAEAALWAVLPDLLNSSAPQYLPTPSEQRQARRLLRRHCFDSIIAAVRQTLSTYHPSPGQPPAITRFGFAVGLPSFRVALAQSPTVIEHVPIDGGDQDNVSTDFWLEYERVTTRRPTRAEHHRITAVAKVVEWHRLLIWLDRWERAHAGTTGTLTPGYFEACAAGQAADHISQPTHIPNVAEPPAQPISIPPAMPAVSPEQHQVYDRLIALGIKKAHALAQAPTTTGALVEAWVLAAGDSSIKNRSAYIAAGVTSGHFPKLTPSKHSTLSLPAPLPAALGDSSSPIWTACLIQLAAQLPHNEVETWIRPCSLLELDEHMVVIAAPNVFVRQELEQRYRAVIQRVVTEVAGQPVEPLFVIAPTPSSHAYQ